MTVGHGNLHQIVEELQALGVVHILRDLRPHGVDVYLLPRELVQHLHGLRNGGIPEVLPDEVLYVVQFGLQGFTIGLDDGGR